VSAARARFGSINGVLHAAGLLRDAFIPKKTISEWRSVLNPKIHGTINLDEATAAESLDFFVLFSSLSSVLGSAGQTDYSYANCFLNHFAGLRNQWRREGKRTGKSLAIAWPLWRNGGMKVDSQVEKFLNVTVGLDALAENDGMRVFEKGIGTALESFAVLRGRRDKIRSSLEIELIAGSSTPRHDAMSVNPDRLSEEELEKTIETELEEISVWLDQRARE
jgi:polyketide synthase PksN